MDISKQILAYIKITRPLNVILTFFVVIVAAYISQNKNLDLPFVILASLAAALTAAAGNIINDIYDIETDKISHPQRSLVVNTISKKQAWYYYLFINCASVFIAASLSSVLLTLVFVVTFLIFIYSAYLKRLPLIGNISIALITATAFIYGGFVADNPAVAIIPAGFAFLINLIREIVKDVQDIEGDSILKYRTFPIIFGIDKSNRIISLLIVLLLGATFYPFLTHLYKIEYFLIVMIFINPLLVLCTKFLFDEKKVNRYSIVSSLLKFNMLIGLMAIWFGR